MMAMEGFDWAADKRLLKEYQRQNRMDDAMKLVRRWAERLGKPAFSEGRDFMSGYQHILENKELDGLCGGRPKKPQVMSEDRLGALPDDPNDDDGLLVSWSVPKATRDEAISEVYNVITAGLEIQEGSDDEEITEADLMAVSNL